MKITNTNGKITFSNSADGDVFDLANLGTGGGGLPVGTTPGTVAAGDDSRIVNAASTQQVANAVLQLANTTQSSLALKADLIDGKIVAAQIPNISASKIDGVLDPSNIPPVGASVIASGDLDTLTGDQQTTIVAGSIVTTQDGSQYIYKGTGSKTDAASYIVKGVAPVEWTAVQNKPTFGSAALKDVGTTTGTVAAGDDARIANAVQASRQITTTGLLTGGGSLATDRTFAVTPATSAEANAGTGNGVMTASLTASAIANLAVAPARTLSTSGLITGGGSLAADRTFTVTAATLTEARAGTGSGVMTANLTASAIANLAIPATRSLSTSGLITGGGTLAADRTFTVTPATTSEAQAGTGNGVMTASLTASAIAALAPGSAVQPSRVINTTGLITGGGTLEVDRTFNVAAATTAEARAGTGNGVMTASLTSQAISALGTQASSEAINFVSKIFNLADYGASTSNPNNAPAFMAALADLNASASGGAILFPERYEVTTPIFANINNPIALIGHHRGTGFNFRGTGITTGLYINATVAHGTITAQNLRFDTFDCTNMADAVVLRGGGERQSVTVSDVMATSNGPAFTGALLKVINPSNSMLRNVVVEGNQGAYGTSGVGIHLVGDGGPLKIPVGDCTVVACRALTVGTGFKVTSSTEAGKAYYEGTHFEGCTVVGAQYGLDVTGAWYQVPGHGWFGGHMNVQKSCFELSAIAQFKISGGLFYLDCNNGPIAIVNMSNVTDVNINNNLFYLIDQLNGTNPQQACQAVMCGNGAGFVSVTHNTCYFNANSPIIRSLAGAAYLRHGFNTKINGGTLVTALAGTGATYYGGNVTATV